MSRIIPFGNIPDSQTFPDGIYRMTVEKFEATQTKEKEGKVQKFMYALTSKIVEPAQFKGLLFSEWFVIGTDNDPDAEQLETWQTSIGGRSLKKFAKALGIPLGDEEDSDAFEAAVRGGEYLATIVQKVEPDRKKVGGIEQDNPYKGQVRNNTTAYWKVGEKEPALTNGHDKPAAKAGRPANRAAAPAAEKAAPSDEVKCSACPPGAAKVKRTDLKAHVEKHMADMAGAGADDE